MKFTAASQESSPSPVVPPVILIVDDSEPTARSLAKVLSAADFPTSISLRGADAVEYVTEHPICAAVVDIHLPDLNGLIVTQKLRERVGPNVPIIILSGDTSMELLNALPHVGATYFFSKPVNSRQLVDRLRRSMNPAGDASAE